MRADNPVRSHQSFDCPRRERRVQLTDGPDAACPLHADLGRATFHLFDRLEAHLMSYQDAAVRRCELWQHGRNFKNRGGQ